MYRSLTVATSQGNPIDDDRQPNIEFVADIPYGRDYPDSDLWCDRDGSVYHEDGSAA